MFYDDDTYAIDVKNPLPEGCIYYNEAKARLERA